MSYMKINFSKFKSIISVANYFDSDAKCKAALVEMRWGKEDGTIEVDCPFCGSKHIYNRADGRYICHECGKSFSVTSKTIFHATKISLAKWFMAMYQMASHKKGISSCQVARDIETTQANAWYMMQKIRTLFGFEDAVILDGEVEMDEMYLGGKEANKHESKKTEGTQGRSTKTKTPIFGMAEREGDVVVKKVENTQAKTLMPIIKQYVRENAWVFTDELSSYMGLRKEGYNHDVVFHADKEFVRGRAFTNTIEGFWGHFKRVIFGTYHFVSKKWLQAYIDEQVYRWNTRKMEDGSRFATIFERAAKGFVTCNEIRCRVAA